MNPQMRKLVEPVALLVVSAGFLLLTARVLLRGQFYYAQATFELAAGWVFYLDRVAVAVSPAGLAAAAVCLAGLAVGLHLFLAWLYRRAQPSDPARGWRPRWTGAVLGVLLLAVVAGIAAVGVVHQTAWLVNSPVPLTRDANRLSSGDHPSDGLAGRGR